MFGLLSLFCFGSLVGEVSNDSNFSVLAVWSQVHGEGSHGANDQVFSR